MLENSNTERAIENTVDKWQVHRIRRRKSCACVDAADAIERLAYAIGKQVNAKQAELRHLQTREADLCRTDAAPDIENAFTRLRLQRAFEKIAERIIPPSFANVFERKRRERIEAADHVSEAGLYHAASVKSDRSAWQLVYPPHVPRTLTADSRIARSKDQVSCDLAGEMAIVNLANGVYYGLDPTGARIWNLLGDTLTFDELCHALVGVYEVDPSRLENDVRAFVGDLADQGLVDIT